METNNNNWLPAGYEQPKQVGNYYRLEDGVNKFRVMSAPIMFYEFWNISNKPVRVKEYPKEKPTDIREDSKIKFAWAFLVYSYKASKIQILEITQSTIQEAMNDLVCSEDWGNPQSYDISITRKGEKLETTYTVQPSPHKPVPAEAVEALENNPVNLRKLLTGEDPFVIE